MTDTNYFEKVRWRFIRWLIKGRASKRTLLSLEFENLCGSRTQPPITEHFFDAKLHLGCGKRILPNWVNVDAVGGDYKVDFRRQKLPFPDNSFQCVVSQHVIEHLHVVEEIPHLFREINRVLSSGGIFWVSTPDMRLVCEHYINGKSQLLLEDMISRHPDFSLGKAPSSQMVNWLFHQGGQHVNLFDYEMLKYSLNDAGFSHVERSSEAELLERYPDFPERNDSFITLHAVAIKQ